MRQSRAAIEHRARRRCAGASHAPDDTEITRLRYNRYLGKQDDDDWIPFLRDASGSIVAGETCSIRQGDFRCQVGNSGWSSSKETDSVPRCVALSNSGPATFQIVGFWSSSRRWSSSSTASVAAQQDLACDYTYARPCDDFGGSLSLDTRRYGDGTHSLELRANDAAGNEASEGPRVVVFDNPDRPSGGGDDDDEGGSSGRGGGGGPGGGSGGGGGSSTPGPSAAPPASFVPSAHVTSARLGRSYLFVAGARTP